MCISIGAGFDVSCGPIGLMGMEALPIGFTMGQLTVLGLKRSSQLRRLVCALAMVV